MKLFLIRHADALSGGDDTARRLSPKGIRQSKGLADLLQASAIKLPREWHHSTLIRSRETGLILTEHLKSHHILREREGLAPGDPLLPLTRELEPQTRDLCWLGHNPQLEQLAAYLLTGDAHSGVVQVTKGTILCLHRKIVAHPDHGAIQRWTLKWMLTPRVCPGQSL